VCAAALTLAAAFLFGLVQRSYWALAVPVTITVLAALALAFSIGWSIATVRGIPPQAEPYTGRGSLWAARAICAISVALGAAFLWGVLRQSYWALAIPVAVAVLGLAAMVFQIGWAVIRKRDTLPLKEARERARDLAPSGGAPE
jgi:hypothetical protein